MWWATFGEIVKKKVSRFLLERYLGHYVEDRISVQQLEVEIINGTGTISDVKLSCQALNELCEKQSLGIQVTQGHIGSVSICIPYDSIFTKDSSVELSNLSITIRPKPRDTDGKSMLESMWSSMSNSIQLAEECMQKEEIPAVSRIEGIEKFAQIIDNVLNRVKARLINTTLRIEYLPPDSDCGIALIVKIDSIGYNNEAVNDAPKQRQPEADDEQNQQQQQQQQQQANRKSLPSANYDTHNISMEGITFYTEEFRIHDPRRQQQKQRRKQEFYDNPGSSVYSEQFLSTMSELPDLTTGGGGGGGAFGGSNEYYSQTNDCDNSSNSNIYKQSCSGSTTETEDEEDEEQTQFRSGEILAGRITSNQDIRVKMKQSDNLAGPNVEFEISLGCLQLFLSPRQLHLIILMSDTFLGVNEIPVQNKSSPYDLHPQVQRGDMADFEFKHNVSRMTGGVGMDQGWSLADPMQTIQEQAEFLESDFREEEMASVESSNSSMTSSFATTSSGSRATSTSKRRTINPDADADISKFNVRISALAFVLLHEELLVESSHITANESPLNRASVQHLMLKAERFFRSVGNLDIGHSEKDVLNAGMIMDSGCDNSRLRLILAPVVLDGEQQRNRLGHLLRFSASVACADLREVMPDISIPLVEFSRENSSNATLSKPTEIVMDFKQTCNALKETKGLRFAPPKTEIRFSLAPFVTEFDVAIQDRLSALLYQCPFADYRTPVNSPATPPKVAINRRMEPKTEIYFDSSSIDFRLRFPIPDLRPIHDTQRVPWWRRNVRPDFLLVKLQQARATICLTPHPLYDISANEIELFYHESELKSDSVNIGKAVMTDNLGTTFSFRNNEPPQEKSGVEYPRIIIELPSEAAIEKIMDAKIEEAVDLQNQTNHEESDSENTSGESFTIRPGKSREETPFSAKRVCRESDTPHVSASTGDSGVHILPGDSEDLNVFCEAAMKQSKMRIQFEFPVVSMQLRSKHLYEIIYNRITTDLLLWEPSAPAATAAAEASAHLSASKMAFQESSIDLANMGMTDSIYTPFIMCQSVVQLDSSSSVTNSESESDSDGIFYSIYERSNKCSPGDSDNQRQHPKLSSTPRQKQLHRKASFIDRSNAIAFQLNIGQGILTMFAPVRDAQNHVIPGQLGEFTVKLQSTYLFSVNGFHGNKNLGYLCILGKAAEIYHCGLIPTPVGNPPLRLVSSVLPSYLCSTLYSTPEKLTLNEQQGCPNREMFSLVIQIKALPEHNVKRIRMAAGIQLTTLRHHTTLPQHWWLTQLRDMFDVSDYPVPGYTPLGVATEMHLHLWDCAIDYRPLYFPYRAVISIGSYMISSNITTENSGLTLKFIAEEAALCLAPQNVSPPNVKHDKEQQSRRSSFSFFNDDNKVTALPSTELVCLVEVGLFEISLQLQEKATSSLPKFDLRTTMTDVHLRSCADSGQALALLIGYLAAEGDLISQDDGASSIGDDESNKGLPFGHEHEEELLSLKKGSQTPGVTPKQQQLVNTLITEAMEESISVQSDVSDSSRDDQLLADGEGVEVFFFPDEDQSAAARKMLMNNLISDNSNKRRFTSDDDSLSIDEGSSVPSSYQDDDHYLKQKTFDKSSEDGISTNTEMRDLLNFECSVMGLQQEKDDDDEAVEALPQVTMDLGDVNRADCSTPKPLAKFQKNPNQNLSSDTDDEFCFIVDEERPHRGNQEVPLLEDSFRVIDNHYSVPIEKTDLLAAPKGFPTAITRYAICEMSVTWHMYGGHDFGTDEDKKKHKYRKSHPEHSDLHLPMTEAYKSGVSYSKGSPSVTFGRPRVHQLSWKNRGGPQRRHDIMMEIQINKVKFSHEVYPPNTEQASRQVLVVSEFEIWDRLAVSDIKKFLYHWNIGQRPSKANNHMIVIKALHLRPNPVLPAQECCLRISLLPIRMNIDQDSLLFMINFFNQLGGGSDLNEPEHSKQIVRGSSHIMPSAHQVPIMTVDLPEAVQEMQARKIVSENLMLLIEEKENKSNEQPEACVEGNDNTPPIYFRTVIFEPDVPIRIDYHGKRVELSHGPLAGLLMGLGHLQCSDIRLKKICYKRGILGVERLLNFLLHEWLNDIKKKQLPMILSGVGPMYYLVQLFQGIYDLFWLPFEQYQLDGRIVWGLQRGAHSFTARTALAALEITMRVIHLLQLTAETAYDMVSPGPSVRRGRGIKKGKRKRLHPPQDIREGMNNALQIVREGISETAHNLVELTAQEHDQKGYTGAVGAVVRQLAPIAVQPIVLATQATSNVLGGVKNQLVPDARAEAREKYKDDVE
ncbi:autophagy-related protein 2 homolog B [Toxorhynchites rutilus septentrionalis]|uniref:autophagy-related protein 2 homolog B n=1 Tax=Toxorhynchites rutilus septentrionalis TaxID=329112 RepID=UPI00247855B6|nr:autophagy-related protein 2 homolog B [Toxorhynchites rutilus septentrionalis]XP_055617381.1 autophagy-related protein 2 homolog B [Toxorhynchites rutilus septentrionalis]